MGRHFRRYNSHKYCLAVSAPPFEPASEKYPLNNFKLSHSMVRNYSSNIHLAGTLLLPSRVIDADDSLNKPIVSHKELTGEALQPRELEKNLQSFDSTSLISFVTKIGLSIIRDQLISADEYQVQVAARFLPPDQYSKYLTISGYSNRTHCQSIRAIINSLHVLNFLKTIILNHKLGGSRTVDDHSNSGNASDAFMLLRAFRSPPTNVDNRESVALKKQVFGELIRNSILLRRENYQALVGRYHQLLFVIPNSHSVEKTFPTSIQDIFMESEGINLRLFFAVGAWLLTRLFNASRIESEPEQVMDFNQLSLINWQMEFSLPEIPAGSIQLIRNLLSMDLTRVKERFLKLEQDASNKNLCLSYEYNLLPFIEKPLLELNESCTVISHYPFLAEKVTSGIFWILFDFLKNKWGKTPGGFQDYWGFLCQKYSEQIFRKDITVIQKNKFKSYFDPLYTKGGSEARGADIILYDKIKKELFLFDVTYSALRIETAFNQDNIKDLSDGINKLVDKAEQLDDVIKDIKSGILQLDNLDKRKIRKYRPYIITMSNYPIWAFIWNSTVGVWQGIDERLKIKDCFLDDKIAALQIFNIGELEELGARHRNGVPIFEMLRGWSNSRKWQKGALLDYLFAQHKKKADYSTIGSQFNSAMRFNAETFANQRLTESSLAQLE